MGQKWLNVGAYSVRTVGTSRLNASAPLGARDRASGSPAKRRRLTFPTGAALADQEEEDEDADADGDALQPTLHVVRGVGCARS